MPLSDAQIERYARQIILPEVGGRGQQRLLASSVRISGLDPASRVAALYLAGAGVGSLVVTGGVPDYAQRLRELNPDVTVATTVNSGSTFDVALLTDPHAASAASRGARLVLVAGEEEKGWWIAGLPSNPGSLPCFRCADLPFSRKLSEESSVEAGSFLALAVLRELLGVGVTLGGFLVRFQRSGETVGLQPLSRRERFADCGHEGIREA